MSAGLRLAAASFALIFAAPLQSRAEQPPGGTTAHDLKPGAAIGAENASDYSTHLPEAAKFALAHGLRMTLSPARRLEWSTGFKQATERYSAQVRLDENDHMQNYIAGMPFPLIDVVDPKAAVKIAYNWHMGPFMPDDFTLAPWSSNAYAADLANGMHIVPKPDYDYACEQFDFLRFAHRTEVDPRPTLGDNAQGIEWKARCNKWIADVSGSGGEGAGIWIRYLNPEKPDEFYGFNPSSRRVRRTAVSLASYPNEQCRSCHQPFWAYALPKTETYRYRLLGTTTLLACLSATGVPAGIRDSGNGLALTEEPFEPRNVYILEMTPGPAGDQSLRTVIFIDSEVYVWLAAEFYDSSGLTASAIPLWKMQPSREGGSLFELAGSFYVPTREKLFRSLVPAHPSFRQEINTGNVAPGAFNPQFMAR